MLEFIIFFLKDSPIAIVLEFVTASCTVAPLIITVWRLIRYKADTLEFLENIGSFREYGETIKHFRKRMDKYTNPTFTPMLSTATHFSNKKDSATITFKDLWEYITNRDNNRKVLIIYSQAGMGKSRLLRHITYKLILDARKRIRKMKGMRHFPLVVNGVYYSEFRGKDSVDDLVREIRETREKETESINYIILDGFDECHEFFTGDSTDDVLTNLLRLLNDERICEGIRRIIISSRVDMFEHEESALECVYTTVENKGSFNDEPVDLVKINDFDTKQIIDRYKTVYKLDKPQNGMLTVKKLRKYLAARSNPILKIPIFIEHADTLFNNTNENFIESYEEGLDKIIGVRLEKEYEIYTGKNYRELKGKDELKKAYTKEMMTVLGTAAFDMYKKKFLFLLVDEYSAISCKYKMQKERLLIVREAGNPLDRFSFQHKLFYEYFLIYHIVKNEMAMSFTDRQKLLRACYDVNERSMSFNPSFAKSLYAYILYKERPETIEDNIMSFKLDKRKSYIQLYKLFGAESITIMDEPTLDIDRIIFLLPFASSFFYRNFQLNNTEEITRYLDERFLEIDETALLDCSGAERFGKLAVLDTTIGKINVNELERFSEIDEIRIAIENPCELDNLINADICSNIKLLVRTEAVFLPELVKKIIEANLTQPKFSFFNTIKMETLVNVVISFRPENSETSFDVLLFLEGVYFIELYYSSFINDDTYDAWYMILVMCERNPRGFYHFLRDLYKKRLENYGENHPFTLNALIIYHCVWCARFILSGNQSYDIDDECSHALMNVDLQGIHIYLQEIILLYRTIGLRIAGRYDEAWEILVIIHKCISEFGGSDKYLFTINISLIDTLFMQNRLNEALTLCNSTLNNFIYISDHPIYNIAIFYRGIIYLNMDSFKEAMKDLEVAAEKNNVVAQNVLGDCYYDEEDYKNAVRWYQKAAELGYIPAQNSLGDCCYFGKGVEQNYTKAVEWYQMAAEREYVPAQNSLGDCYYYGKGVEQNYTKAVEWYQMAAEREYVPAQNSLGDCYYFGDGVEQDYKKAESWFQKATENGYSETQYNWRNFKWN